MMEKELLCQKVACVNCDVSTKANVLFPKSCANSATHSVKYLNVFKTSLVVKWLSLHAPNAGGLGSIPGQGTRSHRPQLRVCRLQLKNPDAAVTIKGPVCCDLDLVQ